MLEEQEAQYEIEKILSTYSGEISNEDEIVKLKKLLSVRQKLNRKERKEFKKQYLIIKQAFQFCQKEQKKLYQAKKRLKKLKKYNSDEKGSSEIKSLEEEIIFYNNFITSKSTENVKIIFNLYKKVLAQHRLFMLNIIFTIIYCLGFFVFGGIVAYLNNDKYNFSYLISVIIIGIIGLIYILFYLKFYFHNQNFTWKVKLIKYLFYLSIWSFIYTFYLVWVFICYNVEKNPYTAIPLVISLALLVISTTFDFTTSSGLFDDIEAVLSLAAIIMISGYIIGTVFDNFFVKCVNQILLVFASILLIYLVIKKFVLEQPKIDGTKLLYALILIVSTICVCILTLYNLFWNNDAQSQDLFNASISVFAGIVGGALTMAGVAWTIRHSTKERELTEEKRETERREEEKKKAKPYFTFEMLQGSFNNFDDKKVCIEEAIEFNTIPVAAIIENSNYSAFTIERIYHDDEWRRCYVNNVLIPGSHVYLRFSVDCLDDIFLQVRDTIDNVYFYEIRLGISRCSLENEKHLIYYTILSICEISEDELNERIHKEQENGSV